MTKKDAKPTEAKPPKPERRSLKALYIAIAATLAFLAADLGTKEWASDGLSVEHPATPPPICETPGRNQRLRTEPHVIVDGLVELSYAENCGAAFGLLNDAPDGVRRGLFGVAAIAATFILFWMFFQGRGGPWFAYSVPLIVSGAVGNLVDRVRLGYVVDFIRVHYDQPFDFLFWHYEHFEYPTFNVADITITVGVAMLIIDGFLQERKEKQAKQAAKAEVELDDEAADEDDAPPKPKAKKKRKKKPRRAKPSEPDGEDAAEE